MPAFCRALKDGRSGQRALIVRIASAEGIGVALRSSGHQVHAIGLGARHDGREEAVRSREVRRHEVVEVEIAGIGWITGVAAIVVAHGAIAVGIEEWRLILAGVIGGGLHEAIERGRVFPDRIVVGPVDVAFIPGGARDSRCRRWADGRREPVCRSGPRRSSWSGSGFEQGGFVGGGELPAGGLNCGNPSKGLIGITVVSPVFAKFAEVVVEGTVFLREENDVIDGGIEGRGHGLIAQQSQAQVAVVPVQAPPQPANMEKVEGAPGVSVSVTCVLAAKVAEQVPGQVIPAGELATVPWQARCHWR